MKWEVLETNYISNLLEQCYDENDTKLVYIKRRGFEHLTLSEYNYIRSKNNLPMISIKNIERILYETVITFSEINKETGISRTMLSMILRETRNTTIQALIKICNAISNKNPNIDKSLILE